MLKSATILESLPVPFCAFMSDDAETIVNYAADGADTEYGSALVTLVEISGGAARELGAQMAVRGDGGYCGYVSGGCTEAAVAAEALEAIKRGSDRCLHLGEGSRFFDIILPCGGGITLAIHVVKDAKPLRQVINALGERKRIALAYHPGSQSIATTGVPFEGTAAWHDGRFIRTFRPSLRLILFGRGIELKATERLATACAFEVFSFERGAGALGEIDMDADTAIALLFHDLDHELPCLGAALDGKPFYLGALGSRRTHERRCKTLWAMGYTKAQTDRIKAPIGLYGPTRDAHSLALSILADVAAVRQRWASGSGQVDVHRSGQGRANPVSIA